MSAARKKPLRTRLPRAEWLVGLTLLLVASFLAALTVLVVRQAADLRTQYTARDALARQVERLGGKPVAGPPGSRGTPGKSVTGPRGQKGDKGDTGASGKPAPTITPSAGESGKPGTPGKDSDVPGPASTVEGPRGEPGQDATGVPGEAGKDGTNGKDGTDGRNGQPPAGWTYTDPTGAKYECTPVSNFDPDAPRYDCRLTDPAPNNEPDQPAPSNAALDPTRRQYM